MKGRYPKHVSGRTTRQTPHRRDERKVFVKTKANLRDIFFCLATEEQKIGLLRLNIAEKKHGRE